MAVWFADPISGDGDIETAEIFVVDWGASVDDYQVQLLTSDETAGIAGAVIAKTIQVRKSDQVQTSTIIDSQVWGAVQKLAGVGIDLDSEGLGGDVQILGVLIPGADGLGGITGVDPTLVAAIPEPCSLLLMAAGGLALIRRRRS